MINHFVCRIVIKCQNIFSAFLHHSKIEYDVEGYLVLGKRNAVAVDNFSASRRDGDCFCGILLRIRGIFPAIDNLELK